MYSTVSIAGVTLFIMLFAVINLMAAVTDKNRPKPGPGANHKPLPPAA